MRKQYKMKTVMNVILLMNALIAQGQTNSIQEIPVNTPSVNTFMRQNTHPVNYNVGSVDISIPLYTISSNGVEMPIFLSYNSKGLRPNEFTTVLGQGWTLDAAPSLIRHVNGLADKSVYTFPAKFSGASNQELYFLSQGSHDVYPDQYFYKLLNKQGSFFVVNNKPITVPYDPVRINILPNDEGFVITDESGMMYCFGRSSDKSQSLREMSSQGGITTHVSSWYITEIISPHKKDTVAFQYSSEKNVRQKLFNTTVVVEDVPIELNEYFNEPLLPSINNISNPHNSRVPGIHYINANRIIHQYFYPGEYMNQPESFTSEYLRGYSDCSWDSDVNLATRVLSSIVFKSGKVKFNYADNGQSAYLRELIDMQIEDNSFNTIKRIRFHNSFENSDRISDPVKYPMLDSDEALLLRLRENLEKSLITTYTYTPLLGMTSKTNSQDIKITYHYDEYNQLQYIRDQNGGVMKVYDYSMRNN